MNIWSISRKAAHGNTLVVTLCITAIVGIALASYLSLATSQNQLTMRSQVWNSAMPVVEAGIEEALTHLSNNYGTNMESSGWAWSNNQYAKTNAIGDGYYQVAISQSSPYEIVATGFAPMPGSSTYSSRTVKVVTQPKGVFSGAMIMRTSIDLKGNNIMTDAYDSTDLTKSDNGMYDPTKAEAKGDVTCVAGFFNVGNANIWGHALTGPKTAPTVGPNGAIGDLNWQKSGVSGIEPGWWQDDFNVDFPDVNPPFSTATPPGSESYNGTNFNYVLHDGPYKMSGLGGNVLVMGNAVLYVTDNIKFSGGDVLMILPGASLKVYMAGSSAQFQTIINPNTSPTNFFYYGLPTNTSLDMAGNAAYYGAIYAPEADFTLHGNATLYGSVIANTATLTGNAAVHYDESLLMQFPIRGFIVLSWNEL